MKKIYSTPVSVETKTRIRASILAGSSYTLPSTPGESVEIDTGKEITPYNPEKDGGLGARKRLYFD